MKERPYRDKENTESLEAAERTRDAFYVGPDQRDAGYSIARSATRPFSVHASSRIVLSNDGVESEREDRPESYRHAWESMEADEANLWDEFVSRDPRQMIDDMVTYKQRHFGGDKRRILTCGIVDAKIRVEWLPPAGRDVDSEWELRMYGLIRTGNRQKAIRLMQRTRQLSRSDAGLAVDRMGMQLGILVPSF